VPADPDEPLYEVLRGCVWTPSGMDLRRRHLSATAVANVDAFFRRFGGQQEQPSKADPIDGFGNY